MVCSLVSIILKLAYKQKRNCIKLSKTKRVWGEFFHNILCMVSQEECVSCYLLTDQISFCMIAFTS